MTQLTLDLGLDEPRDRHADAEARQVVYVAVRPSLSVQVLRASVAALHVLLAEHPNAGVDVVGLARDDTTYRVTIALDCGPSDQIVRGSPEVRAAFDLALDIFTIGGTMWPYLPCYRADPSGAEREAAAALPRLLGGRDTTLTGLPIANMANDDVRNAP